MKKIMYLINNFLKNKHLNFTLKMSYCHVFNKFNHNYI